MPATLTEFLTPEDLKQIGNLQVLARLVVEGFCSGLHRSPHKGFSVEFKQHRPYVHGDELRRLDWKLYGKTDRFYIREYEEETNLRATILLDLSGSMNYTGTAKGAVSKVYYATRVAACLSYLMLQQADSVGLVTFDTKMRRYIPPRSKASHLRVLIDEMQSAKPGGETEIGKVFHDLVPKIHRRGLLIVLSDLFGDATELLSALAHFRHAKHEIIVFQIWDRDELDFPFRQWTRFDSLEIAGRHEMIDPASLRQAYLSNLEKFREELKMGCRRHRIDLVPLITDEPYAQSLAKYLSLRRKALMIFMSFLWMGVAAFNVPILIHLFNRSRFKVVKWGAMHLLENVIRQNRRRIKIEQWILLAIRMLIPVALALAMAGPVLTGCQQLSGNKEASLVMLFDNSYSMEAGGAQRSNFAQGREEAVNLLNELPRGSEAMVMTMGGGPVRLTDRASVNMSRLTELLGKVEPGYGAADIVGSLEAGATALSEMKGSAKRDVVLMSDFQKTDWGDDQAPARKRIVEIFANMPLKPSITLYRVGKPVTDNVAVDSLELSRAVVGVNQKMTVRANVHNYGDRRWSDLRVDLKVDGTDRSTQMVQLDPKAQVQVLFEVDFKTAGSHFVEVHADADALKADNSYLAAIPVWDRVPVLLVSGDRNAEPMRGETDWLELALSPYKAIKSTLTDLVQTRTIDPGELNPTTMADSRVVILANVPRLTDAQVRDLTQFVKEGGSLIVFPGDRVDASWYNSHLTSDGGGLLPARMTGLRGSLEDERKHAAIAAQHYDHPVTQWFNDPRNGTLSDGKASVWFKLDEPPQGSMVGPGAMGVIARLDTGDALFVDKRFGEGLVIQSAIPCDGDWTNLPPRPFFVPLMQRMVTYAASSFYPPRNVPVDKPLLAFYPIAAAGKTAIVTDPEGGKHDVAIVDRGARALSEFPKTHRPGLYLIEAPGQPAIHFVVNTDRKESDITPLSDEQLKKIASDMGASVVKSWTEYHDLDRTRRYGREIWLWFFWSVAALLALELFLQQFFARRRA